MNIGKQRVVIVGGGLAGCAAALRLADSGASVILLEAKRSLGGRTSSFSMPIEGNGQEQRRVGKATQEVDYCQHVGMGCCTSLLALIERLDQGNHWARHKELHFYGPAGKHQRLAALPLLPAPAHLAGWLLRWPGLRLRDRICVARGMLRLNRLQESLELDQASGLDWLHENRQTENAIHRFWETIIVSALGEQLDRVSLDAVRKVMQDGFLRGRDSFHLIVPKRPLSVLLGNRMLASLQAAGIDVRLGRRVDAIHAPAENRSVSVRSGEESIETDEVIIAVPWHQLPALAQGSPDISELQDVAEQAGELASSPISGVHTWWDRPWMETPHAAIVGRLCQWVFPEPELRLGAGVGADQTYYQIVISASRELPRASPEELERLIREDLARVFPAVEGAKLLKMKVVTDPRAVFSTQPGARTLRPSNKLNRWCSLAGDWTDTSWPATMEGAVRSGEQAAECIVLGR